MQESFRVTKKVGRKNPTHLFNLLFNSLFQLAF
nr:MAG TPA: hypothetical protein [Caudoviricetes sp.]